jgi:hypothetical protein
MVIYLSLLICILGLVMYWRSVDVKVMEIGKICFWVGLLVFLLTDARLIVAMLARHG